VNGNQNNQSAEGSGAVFVYKIGSPPGAANQTEAVIPGVAKTFALKVTGPADSALALSTVAAPSGGTVGYDNESRQATYTPSIGFTTGTDSFAYRVAGPGGFTATATVRIELLDEARSPARLIAISATMDGGRCAPDSLFRIDATWLNTGPAAPAVLAK
jgi:hypothetical protein